MNDSFLQMAPELMDAARDAALKAGEVIRAGRDGSLGIEEKSQANFVTRVDKDAEAAIRARLARAVENYPVLGEEEGGEVLDAPFYWVVDPLDGTTNYIKGIPYYSVSIALAGRDPVTGIPQPLLGVVHNPLTGEFFHSIRGRGAWLSAPGSADVPLKVHDTSLLSEAVLITGFYYDRGGRMRATLKQIEDFFDRGMICVRRFGSAALDCCQVAAGRCEGFWEHHLNPWDFAAGMLLVEEAGGVFCDWQGARNRLAPGPVLACVPGLKDTMLQVIRTAGEER